ncbi:hypothetical protein KP509_06G056300 [Ceratopteris richardii]|uniref:Protein yippee-like n=1 Tax=Ceratopteris richardii TaxID=49495 RepID=A0A8T2UGN6_CERRI|nr:hypothetical protein KP509_06G056300 [Ceratopteris richardii]KAH7435257.1 hypothetical protein KP509_06G056300 [Ceratopteris richardii]
MGRLFLTKLDGAFYTCKLCHTHLANIEELMSKAFHCRNGPAYLFNSVVNVTVGETEERMMTTGMHIVADIFCICCCQNVGWKYESAFDEAQKYKEGKFILERGRIVGGSKEVSLISSDADEG